jgi:hypothetical protein
MTDQNKKNLIYFEANTMKELFLSMSDWQNKAERRFLSTEIQRDGDKLCCIALTNPSEVIICNGDSRSALGEKAMVYDGKLVVGDHPLDFTRGLE